MMALSKSAKRWLIIASIPVLLLLAVIITAKIYFTSDRLKAIIIPPIEESTRRKVSIREISLSVFPSIAIEVDDVRLSNPVGTKFTQDDFLTLDRLTLTMKLFELLRGKADITDVVLDHPVLRLEKAPSGAKNYSSTPTRYAKGAAQEPAAGAGGALLLSHCEIVNGEIEYLDRKDEGRMMIAGLHQSLRAELKDGEHIVRLEGSASVEKLSYGSSTMWYLADQPLAGDEKLTYDMQNDVLTFDECSMKLRELPLSMTGTISQIKAETMIMNLSVKSPGAGMPELLSLIPPEFLKKAAGLTSTGEVAFTMRMKGPFDDAQNPGVSGTCTISGGTVRYAALPNSITGINLKGSFDRPTARVGATGIGTFSIDDFSARFGADEIGGALSVTNFTDPNLSASFHGSLNLAGVKEYYPLESGTELSGTMKMEVKLDGKAKNLQSLKASGKAEFQDVTIKSGATGTPLKHLNGTIAFSNQVVESKQLAMSIGESDLNLTFSVKNYLGLVMPAAAGSAGKPIASVSLKSNQLRTADITGGEKPATGNPPAKPGALAPPMLLPGIDLDANVEIGKLVTEKFTFNDAHGSLAVSDGVVNMKNMSVRAFQGTIQTKGTIDLRNSAKRPFDLDMNISGVQSNELLSKFSSFGQYLFGKFSTVTKLKGDLNDTLGLDTKTLLGNGTVQISEGKLSGYPLTTKLADVTGVNELREVNFKNWTNAFAIENGRIQVKDLKVNAGTTDFMMGGSQGLDGSLDYSLTVILPGSVSDRIKVGGTTGELLQLFKDKDGRYSFMFDVGGTTTAPAISLNAKAQEGAAKQKLEDELKKKAQEGLMKLFKKP